MTSTKRVTLYLVRHGRTELNAGGMLRGHLDVPLDDVGRAEATALGELFRTTTISSAGTSPLQRAADTGGAILDGHDTVGLVTEPDLIDRDWGPWAGHREGEVARRFGSLDRAPGVEPAEHLTARAVGALTRLVAGGPGTAVLAVTHDAVIHAALAALTPDIRGLAQPTGCWNQLFFDGSRWHAQVVAAVPGDGNKPGDGNEPGEPDTDIG